MSSDDDWTTAGGEVDREEPELSDDEIFAIERPDPSLLPYYVLSSLLLGPFFFLALIPLAFRYHTMRYRFDEKGVAMRWGLLFRREITLTYARIQDIHLASNFVERWLGLARVEIQTASGSARAEMTIEGLLEYRAIRDFLYARMRGTRTPASATRTAMPSGGDSAAPAADAGSAAELSTTFAELTAELGRLREALAERRRGDKSSAEPSDNSSAEPSDNSSALPSDNSGGSVDG